VAIGFDWFTAVLRHHGLESDIGIAAPANFTEKVVVDNFVFEFVLLRVHDAGAHVD